MRISDWSSDVCSSDLRRFLRRRYRRMASEPSAQPWCLHKVRHSTTIQRIDMFKNPILFRTHATAVDGASVEHSYVQFELSHTGLKSCQEQCDIFKTSDGLQYMPYI